MCYSRRVSGREWMSRGDVRLRTLPYGGDPVDSGLISGETDLVIGRLVDPPDSLVVQELTTDGLACVVRARWSARA